MPFFNMTTTRWRASATEINNDQTLIIGGRDENWNYLKTTELISSSGTEKGKDFPVTIQDHCTFKINATHALGLRLKAFISIRTRIIQTLSIIRLICFSKNIKK